MTATILSEGSRRQVPPGRTARLRVGDAASVCRMAIAALLVTVVGLALLALAPRLFGFQGHVVVSGSMEPRLSPGDVVLTRPVLPQDLEPGQVLLFPDPEGADRLVLHRLVSFDERGDLVTRGDANQSNDPTHVPAASVIGQAQVRVPYVGLPAYWRVTGQWGQLALLTALLAAGAVSTLGPATGPRGLTSADRRAATPAPDRVVPRVGLPPVPATGRHGAGDRDRTTPTVGRPVAEPRTACSTSAARGR